MSKQEIIENEAKLVAVGVKKRLKRHASHLHQPLLSNLLGTVQPVCLYAIG